MGRCLKQEHPELGEWLAMAREQYRDAKLAIIDEAKTADGRPDWKAAAWALEKITEGFSLLEKIRERLPRESPILEGGEDS